MKRCVGWVLWPSCEQCQDTPKENLCQSNIGCWTADNHFSWDWGTLNSRPLTCLSADPGDYSVITPAQILIGRNLQASPAKDTHVTEHTSRNITKSVQYQQRLVNWLWNLWHAEYLKFWHPSKNGLRLVARYIKVTWSLLAKITQLGVSGNVRAWIPTIQVVMVLSGYTFLKPVMLILLLNLTELTKKYWQILSLMRTLLINLLMHSMHRAGGCSALKVFPVSLLVYGRVGTRPYVSLQGLGPPFWFFYMCFCPWVVNSCSLMIMFIFRK